MAEVKTGTYPDFYVVGAPKCGTTALQDYLSQAPDVFMPEGKEFHHFADDLLRPDDPLLDRDRYLALFAGAAPKQLVGETSVFHLMSENAARNIASVAPDARIVAMVRNPLEMIPALHSQCVYNGDEPLTDLGAALDAEADRARGERVPGGLRFPERLLYTRAVRFAEQIERYRALFRNVHVVVYDDFRRDTVGAFRATMEFLGADATFVPDVRVVNANKRVRSRRLQDWTRSPTGLPARVAGWLPGPLRRAAQATFRRLNVRHAPREPLPSVLRARLVRACAIEVERLGDLLGRDLGHWLR